jgi:hypothetical protein
MRSPLPVADRLQRQPTDALCEDVRDQPSLHNNLFSCYSEDILSLKIKGDSNKKDFVKINLR